MRFITIAVQLLRISMTDPWILSLQRLLDLFTEDVSAIGIGTTVHDMAEIDPETLSAQVRPSAGLLVYETLSYMMSFRTEK